MRAATRVSLLSFVLSAALAWPAVEKLVAGGSTSASQPWQRAVYVGFAVAEAVLAAGLLWATTRSLSALIVAGTFSGIAMYRLWLILGGEIHRHCDCFGNRVVSNGQALAFAGGVVMASSLLLGNLSPGRKAGAADNRGPSDRPDRVIVG